MSSPPRAGSLFLSSVPIPIMLTPAETAKGACLRHSPSVKILEFLIRLAMTMMRPKGPANQIGSDVYACLAESESGVRYRPAGRHPRASPPSSSLSPVGKVYGISDLSVLSCGPNAFHDGGPSGAAERAHALPWQPFTMQNSIPLCLCIVSDSPLQFVHEAPKIQAAMPKFR